MRADAHEWRGRVPYEEALAAQRARRDAILAGTADEVLWLLEHDPVITTGRRLVQGLEAAPFPVVRTERGGLATYHGPGQLVGYLLFDASRLGVRRTVCAVETGVIRWLAAEGVAAGRRDGYPGVWVGRDKVCAVGLHFRRGVTMHGFALNLTVDLDAFRAIVPCGITDGGVTSLQALRGAAPEPFQAASSVGEAVLATLVDTPDRGR